MSLMWILFFIAATAFILMFVKLIKATHDLPKIDAKTFEPALAGHPEETVEDVEELKISLSEFVFMDKKGIDLPIEEYDGYVAKGESMKLAGINNGDLMLVPKNYLFQSSTPLPDVFILKRERSNEEEHMNEKAKYKLRRVWAQAYLGGTTELEDVIKGIMVNPEFIALMDKSDYCISTQQMMQEFFDEKRGRFQIYKKEHPHWEEEGHEDSRVIISTTLRPNCSQMTTNEGTHISFSIHPSSLIVGVVAHVYSNPNIRKNTKAD